jgi:hypothetical protein
MDDCPREAVGCQFRAVRAQSRWSLDVFKLIVSVRRGSASNLPGLSGEFSTIEQARAAGSELLRNDRVVRIAIVRNEAPPTFVQSLER